MKYRSANRISARELLLHAERQPEGSSGEPGGSGGPADSNGAAAPTVLLLHAHPDDETLATGGLMVRLVAEGVNVVLVTGTRGERGEVVPGELKPLEGTPRLAEVRVAELEAAMAALGVADHRFLGVADARASGREPRRYSDSGMQWGASGFAEAAADAPSDALSLAPLDEVVGDVLRVVADVHPLVLVSYDERGGYGHPDHVRMHDVAVVVAERAALPLYTIVPVDADALESELEPGDIRVPLDEFGEAKRRALSAHRTQLTVDGDDVIMSGGQRHRMPGVEVFRRWEG